MPRYYFDVYNAKGIFRDDVGDDLSNFDEARSQAQSIMPDIIRSDLPDGELHEVRCEVRDDADRVIYRVRLTCEGTRL